MTWRVVWWRNGWSDWCVKKYQKKKKKHRREKSVMFLCPGFYCAWEEQPLPPHQQSKHSSPAPSERRTTVTLENPPSVEEKTPSVFVHRRLIHLAEPLGMLARLRKQISQTRSSRSFVCGDNDLTVPASLSESRPLECLLIP